jgi:hypothetical protein
LSANEKRLRSKRGTKRAEESGEGKKTARDSRVSGGNGKKEKKKKSQYNKQKS